MFRSVNLEMSLKPFKKTDRESLRGVCSTVFRQWAALLKGRESISVMLWVGDGSELLDYAGVMEDPFEWCRFVGTANLPYRTPDEPMETSLHQKKQDYMPDAPVMTYGILREIVALIKEEGKKAFPDAVIRVGETFDIGPEFAISDFKYHRHTECLNLASGCDSYGFLDATSILHADDRRYAAYPDGIPEGTPFGTFFGKQASAFLTDMGFDYLWLSNGIGFSADPWKKTGKIFDGERYYPERLSETKAKVFGFWKLFREACPDIPLETRGTNNSAGIDYASDGVPLYDLYRSGLGIVAPPNSPWAAINDNFGLELMGHMTRVCLLPDEQFPFRYYLHDPWWLNSPWYDRYDGSPCDIYLPMAISRIDESGSVGAANKLNILSIDNSYGGMPDACVNEPLPHFLKAEKDSPDAAAPIVWVYPMREYTTSDDPAMLREMNLGDNFICDAINDGFPLCCVTDTDSFLKHDPAIYRKSIIVSPVPEQRAVSEKLTRLSDRGVGVILYGTPEKLGQLGPIGDRIRTVDVRSGAASMREALAGFGYDVAFMKKTEQTKTPVLAIARRDQALFFSAYNPDTTTAAKFRFPLGAPILCGMEAELSEGYSVYRFIRGEHRECRVFIEQQDGVVSCREAPPKYTRYRRAIRISGLKNATVRLFGEAGCECAVSTVKTSFSPVYDERFTRVRDERYGSFLEGENVSGEIYFLIGHRNTEQAQAASQC